MNMMEFIRQEGSTVQCNTIQYKAI